MEQRQQQIIKGIRLVLTCGGCPEQYDAYQGSSNKLVGYLRLRHGHFTVSCPGVGGEIVYENNPEGDGWFNDDEREGYLRLAVDAIKQWLED